jgi:SSS family solute:Na+ symporter
MIRFLMILILVPMVGNGEQAPASVLAEYIGPPDAQRAAANRGVTMVSSLAVTPGGRLSTLSACINVTSMVSVNDLYLKYINPKASGKRQLVLGKSLSVLVSIVMIAGALGIQALDVITLTDFLLAAGVIITIGIPSVFIAGMFTRRVGTVAMWCGLIPSLMLILWTMASSSGYLPQAVSISIPLYYVSIVGNILTLLIALAASFFIKLKEKDLTNLTVWDQSPKELQ